MKLMRITLTIAVIAVLLSIFFTVQMRQSHASKPVPKIDYIFAGPGSVPFSIDHESKTAPTTFVWPATYSSGGHTAKFGIELTIPASSDAESITVGKGRLLGVAGSDPATFLPALQKALEAKQIATASRHVEALPFTYAILGTKQTRGSDGGFSSDPAGSWISMKVFLGSEEPDYGEVFLNIDPDHGQAEFSIKDSDYGDIVLRHLATIL